MKIKYVAAILMLLVVFSCGKGNRTAPDNNDSSFSEDDSSLDSVEINEVIFTDPQLLRTKISSPAIMDTLIYYLDHTRKGAIVHMNVFLFSHTSVIASVKEALKRGVQLKVIIDSSREDSRNTNNSTISSFHSVFKNSSSEIIAVNNDIDPTWSINHSKYVLFSKVDFPYGVARNVVFSTSHNFTVGQTKMVQDAIVMTNKTLYDEFVANWETMASNAGNNMKEYEYMTKNIGDGISVYFFPRRKGGNWDGNDTILEQLDKLSDYNRDTIRVIMSSTWSGNRGENIANELLHLQNQGVRVEVITMSTLSSTILSTLKTIDKSGGYAKLLDPNIDETHSKIMLIKGVWEGKMQQIILAGSENYGRGALEYNNNQLLRLKNSPLFNDYWNYFESIKSSLY